MAQSTVSVSVFFRESDTVGSVLPRISKYLARLEPVFERNGYAYGRFSEVFLEGSLDDLVGVLSALPGEGIPLCFLVDSRTTEDPFFVTQAQSFAYEISLSSKTVVREGRDNIPLRPVEVRGTADRVMVALNALSPLIFKERTAAPWGGSEWTPTGSGFPPQSTALTQDTYQNRPPSATAGTFNASSVARGGGVSTVDPTRVATAESQQAGGGHYAPPVSALPPPYEADMTPTYPTAQINRPYPATQMTPNYPSTTPIAPHYPNAAQAPTRLENIMRAFPPSVVEGGTSRPSRLAATATQGRNRLEAESRHVPLNSLSSFRDHSRAIPTTGPPPYSSNQLQVMNHTHAPQQTGLGTSSLSSSSAHVSHPYPPAYPPMPPSSNPPIPYPSASAQHAAAAAESLQPRTAVASHNPLAGHLHIPTGPQVVIPGEDGQTIQPAQDNGAEQEFKQTVTIASQFVPRLVGAGGACIAEFQQRSRATMVYGRTADSTGMKVLTITGTMAQVQKGVELVRNKLASWLARDLQGPVRRELYVPNLVISSVIGKGGWKIAEFQLLSGGAINIEPVGEPSHFPLAILCESLNLAQPAKRDEFSQDLQLLNGTVPPMGTPLSETMGQPVFCRRLTLYGTPENVERCVSNISEFVVESVHNVAIRIAGYP
uniref:K Homology domain-containing protein n=1 Tax=Chromera velia CCMP2878 TaxID=1169474 RepID=A0A0G4I8L4_9ALVE|eukprot:Cvel_2001.t1-p1 / transcript=Cvel_2001.t1 / gene=Cvel_2001 / organism=Chromera_velia_CCMP2878 / gene_product=hypothetical protein / transcript_product=hypothetical protein / location=Cvel_scaffold76:99591-101972(-) / protein_length=656 / sequence_SO=supercontig / SO=protein_coding / is_pseudo=false